MTTPEDRQRIEEITKRINRDHFVPFTTNATVLDVFWLLDLVERQEAAARWMGERMLQGVGFRDTGISSDALVAAVVLGREVPERSYPFDLSDLGRCQRAVEFAPAHLKPRAQAILDAFEKHVRQRAS